MLFSYVANILALEFDNCFSGVNGMKKIFALSICVMLVLSLCACGITDIIPSDMKREETQTAEPEEEVFQPVVTGCSSLQDLNNRLGMSFCHPAVMGIQDLSYGITEYEDHTVGEYRFEAYSIEYALLGCPIGGVDITGIVPAPFSSEISEETRFVSKDDMKLAQWFNMDGQYVLIAKDEGALEQDTFEMIADELVKLTFPGWLEEDYLEYYTSLEGDYSDSFSQRAVATAVAKGAESLGLVVHWGSSASEYVEWTMSLTRGEDGLLYYNDCVKTVVTTIVDENGNASEERAAEYENGSGFFSESEGILYWNGAAENDCRECVFKIYIPSEPVADTTSESAQDGAVNDAPEAQS